MYFNGVNTAPRHYSHTEKHFIYYVLAFYRQCKTIYSIYQFIFNIKNFIFENFTFPKFCLILFDFILFFKIFNFFFFLYFWLLENAKKKKYIYSFFFSYTCYWKNTQEHKYTFFFHFFQLRYTKKIYLFFFHFLEYSNKFIKIYFILFSSILQLVKP